MLAIVTNGLQLAVTSRIIPTLMWKYQGHADGPDPMDGFAASLYSSFDVTKIDSKNINFSDNNVTHCL